MGIVTEDQKDPKLGETWSGKRSSGVIWGLQVFCRTQQFQGDRSGSRDPVCGAAGST